MDILRKRMRDLREDNDLNQSALADAMKISQSAISGYECGREPPLDVIFQYAEFFGVSIEYLLGLTNEKKPRTDQDDQILSRMSAAAAKYNTEAFTHGDIMQLAAAFDSYYRSGAPAGNAPMECVTAFLPAVGRVLDAATRKDAPALLIACNEVAQAGLKITGALGSMLGVDQDGQFQNVKQ